MSPRKFIVLSLGVIVWVAGAVSGFVALQRYAAAEGAAEEPSLDAATFVAEHRRPGRALIVMAVHPRCPCTNASLGELTDLMARAGDKLDAILLEYEPVDRPADWPRSSSARKFAGRPSVVIADRGGRMAAAIGAHTSGHVIFADTSGSIRFHGGITVARGHRGLSPAQSAILDVVKGAEPVLATAPVYGCSLDAACAAADADCRTDVQ